MLSKLIKIAYTNEITNSIRLNVTEIEKVKRSVVNVTNEVRYKVIQILCKRCVDLAQQSNKSKYFIFSTTL